MTDPVSEDLPGVPVLDAHRIAADELILPASPDPDPSYDEPTRGEKPRRRRRRTKAEMQAAVAAVPDTSGGGMSTEDRQRLAGALALGFRFAGGVLAASRGPHWELRGEETEALGAVWADALAPYMQSAGRYMPFVVAAISTVGVVAPRLLQERHGRALAAAAPAETTIATTEQSPSETAEDVGSEALGQVLPIDPPPPAPSARTRLTARPRGVPTHADA